MTIYICKFFILMLLCTSCITNKEQLQSNAEISIRTTLCIFRLIPVHRFR